jgi:hypothetical protein
VQLHISTSRVTGVVNELWFAWATREMLEELALYPGVFRVRISDFTAGLAGCGSHLGAVHGIVPAAAGRAISICHYIYLAGGGIDGEKTLAFQFFSRFVHAVAARVVELGGEAECGTSVDMTDKDLVAVGARNTVNVANICSDAAQEKLAEIRSILDASAAGATDAQTHAAVALAKSMPYFRSLGATWDDFVWRAAPSGESTAAAAAPGASGASASAAAAATAPSLAGGASSAAPSPSPTHARLEFTMQELLLMFPALVLPASSSSSSAAAAAESPPPPPPPPALLNVLSADVLREYAHIWPGIARQICFSTPCLTTPTPRPAMHCGPDCRC